MSHVVLITMETLCGITVSEETDGKFFDGFHAGPPEEIECERCRESLKHILECGACLTRVQDHSKSLIADIGKKLIVSGVKASDRSRMALVELQKRAGSYRLNTSAHAPVKKLGKPSLDEMLKVIEMIAGRDLQRRDTNDESLKTHALTGFKKTAGSESQPVNNDPNTRSEDLEMSTAAKPVTSEIINDVEVKRFGEAITLPEGLDIKDAIGVLTRKAAEEDQDVQVSHDFNMTPPEGAIAFLRTLTEMFGFVSAKASPGFFGPTPPMFLSIETSPGVTESIPWGRMALPGLSNKSYIQPAINWVDGAPQFRIVGVVRGKHKAMVQKIADNMRKRTDSLYRGKAIFAAFPEMVEGVEITDFFPKFMALPNINESDLVFSEDIADLIKTALFTPIEYSKECREQGISLKRGILLEGPYGTGKTLTATVTARKCVENGWTFIYLRNVKDLPRAIHFAKAYAPATIFAEDIDQVLGDPDHRDDEVNEILNSIDGIDSKGIEILTVLTTNNVDKITTAMLRPGRLDTVVPVRAPDAKAAIRLVQLFAGGQLAADQDFTAVGEKLAGCIPAMIQEVVKRSKLGAVRRAANGGVLEITSHDVEVAALSMIAHMKLLEPKVADTRSDRERSAEILGDKIVKVVSDLMGSGGVTPKVPNGKGVHTPATS